METQRSNMQFNSNGCPNYTSLHPCLLLCSLYLILMTSKSEYRCLARGRKKGQCTVKEEKQVGVRINNQTISISDKSILA